MKTVLDAQVQFKLTKVAPDLMRLTQSYYFEIIN